MIPLLRSLACALVLPGILIAEEITVELTNGQILEVDLVRTSSAGLQWRLAEGQATQTIPLRRIAMAYFPEPGGWTQAMYAYEGGFFEEAAARFRQLAKLRQNYPVPGNHASLAEWYLLQCYQRLLQEKAIAAQAKRVRSLADSLPPDKRTVSRETKAWLALAEEDWQKAADITASIARANPVSAYLNGRARQALGATHEALAAYASTYKLNLGSSAALSKDALRRSAELLAELDDEERQPELRAQLKLYRELYGAGELWEDAPDSFLALAEQELDTIGPTETEPPVPPLPPLAERDWIHYSELDRPCVFVGRSGGTLRGDVRKEESALVFGPDGGAIDFEEPVPSINMIRIRAVFWSSARNGVLVDYGSGPETGGFTLYLENNALKLFWKPQDQKPADFRLATLQPGVPNFLGLVITPEGLVRGNLTSDPFPEGLEVPVPLKVGGKSPFLVGMGSRGDDGIAQGSDIPPFRGTLYHLSINAGANGPALRKAEINAFGKRLVLRPAAPKPEPVGDSNP